MHLRRCAAGRDIYNVVSFYASVFAGPALRDPA